MCFSSTMTTTTTTSHPRYCRHLARAPFRNAHVHICVVTRIIPAARRKNHRGDHLRGVCEIRVFRLFTEISSWCDTFCELPPLFLLTRLGHPEISSTLRLKVDVCIYMVFQYRRLSVGSLTKTNRTTIKSAIRDHTHIPSSVGMADIYVCVQNRSVIFLCTGAALGPIFTVRFRDWTD